jgi:hypothetical protein
LKQQVVLNLESRFGAVVEDVKAVSEKTLSDRRVHEAQIGAGREVGHLAGWEALGDYSKRGVGFRY